jgi:MTH538 TIR-like domain (DUF1863)
VAKSVFYSFHYERDNWRVQEIMKMGALQGQTILNAQQWEEVKRKGEAAIKQWIADQMAYKSAVVVLVGAQTASRPWVLHEIAYAWDNKKPLVGVRIHGLADGNGKTDSYGDNPFSSVKLAGGGNVGTYVPVYNPTGANSQAVYADISANLLTWVDNAYKRS